MEIIRGAASLFKYRIRHLWPVLKFSCVIALLAFPPHQWAQKAGSGPEIRKTADGICYVSAGIGYDSRMNLPRFSVRLVFATKTQKYLADIEVEISPGPSGKPIRIHSMGPWLHVDLPPGRYKLKARTAEGSEVGRTFDVQKNRTTQMTIVWDIPDREK